MSEADTIAPFVTSILHPSDFSEGSHNAFAHALAMALHNKARLVLLHSEAFRGRGDWSQFPGIRETLTRWHAIPAGVDEADVLEKLAIDVRKVQITGTRPLAAIQDYASERHRPHRSDDRRTRGALTLAPSVPRREDSESYPDHDADRAWACPRFRVQGRWTDLASSSTRSRRPASRRDRRDRGGGARRQEHVGRIGRDLSASRRRGNAAASWPRASGVLVAKDDDDRRARGIDPGDCERARRRSFGTRDGRPAGSIGRPPGQRDRTSREKR